jgi:AraC-like DNA-binding protein
VILSIVPEERCVVSESGWRYVPATASKSVQARECVFGGFSEVSPGSVERLEAPVACTVIVLCCGEPVHLQPALSSGSASRLDAFSAGLQVPAQRARHAGVNDCVEVRLPPLAAYALFGGAIVERNRAPVDLLEIAPLATKILLERLRGTRDWGARLLAVDRFLARGFGESRERIRPELAWAWHTLERSDGQVAVRALAETIGWSERHFINQFRAYFGVRPKAAARRLRFSRAFSDVLAGAGHDLCAIAAHAGFSDQSHMTREFRDLSGLTPAALRKARFNDLPGIPAAALAD